MHDPSSTPRSTAFEGQTPDPAPRLRRAAACGALAAWFAIMVTLSAVLLGRHLVPLPRPSRDDAAMARSLEALRSPNDSSSLFAVHVLYSACACSRRLVEHLVTSERPAGVAEAALLAGASPELEAMLRKRFPVTVVSTEELSERYHVQAVPLLVVLGADGAVRYAGGYTLRKQGPDPRDLEILARARMAGSVEALPVFGCAVAAELRRRLDPTSAL